MAKSTDGNGGQIQVESFRVTCEGAADIMFDAFRGLEAKTPVDQKLYREPDGTLFLPAKNIMSFLCADQKSCANVFEGKKRAAYIREASSLLRIGLDKVPFLRDGKPIVFNGFQAGKDHDVAAGLYTDRSVARVIKNGRLIPAGDMNERPVLACPWTLIFDITLVDLNLGKRLLTPTKIEQWLVHGGLLIGFGTFRPQFGRFFASMERID